MEWKGKMGGFIKIGPRYVKQDEHGLRPFQREALEATSVEINHA